jgi:hypothetical protein
MNEDECRPMVTNVETPDPNRAEFKLLFFPRDRIVRTILRGNKVYNPPGPRYTHWDEERRAPQPPKGAA